MLSYGIFLTQTVMFSLMEPSVFVILLHCCICDAKIEPKPQNNDWKMKKQMTELLQGEPLHRKCEKLLDTWHTDGWATDKMHTSLCTDLKSSYKT